jgi:hypothetical protein
VRPGPAAQITGSRYITLPGMDRTPALRELEQSRPDATATVPPMSLAHEGNTATENVAERKSPCGPRGAPTTLSISGMNWGEQPTPREEPGCPLIEEPALQAAFLEVSDGTRTRDRLDHNSRGWRAGGSYPACWWGEFRSGWGHALTTIELVEHAIETGTELAELGERVPTRWRFWHEQSPSQTLCLGLPRIVLEADRARIVEAPDATRSV